MRLTSYMMRILLLFFMPLAAISQTKVNYRIFHSENLETAGLKVHLNFTASKHSDSTWFHFPTNMWGEDSLFQCLKLLDADNPGCRFKFVPDSNRIVFYHPKAREINFTYRIFQDKEDDEARYINRPKVQNNYFHILGHSLFIVPEQVFEGAKGSPKFSASIEWVNFPSTFRLHNTFASGQKKQLLNVSLWDQLHNSLFVGGDYRISSFLHMNKSVYFAIRGEWLKGYNEDAIFEAIKKVISSQREFWKDDNPDFYTVIMSPTVTRSDSSFKGVSSTGSAVHQGFLVQASNNPFNNFTMLQNLFNHEMMHDWIGGKIKMRHEELNYWFSEGFTDYYAYKNRLRSKHISMSEWVKEFNRNSFKAYWKNPEKNIANYLIKDSFWKIRHVEKVPYQRGAVFAFWLDNQIIKKSNYTKSLDDLMRELLKICVKENKLFTDELFLEVAEKYIGKDISYFFQKHILTGASLEIKNNELIEVFSIETKDGIPELKCNSEDPKKFLLLN